MFPDHVIAMCALGCSTEVIRLQILESCKDPVLLLDAARREPRLMQCIEYWRRPELIKFNQLELQEAKRAYSL